jgi:hypothetical protein
MWPEGSDAIAVTEPTSARRRISDLAEFLYKRANRDGMATGLRWAAIEFSMSRRAYVTKPELGVTNGLRRSAALLRE